MTFREIIKELSRSELRERIADYELRVAESKEIVEETEDRIEVLKKELKERNE